MTRIIVLASRNEGKLTELRSLLSSLDLSVISSFDAGYKLSIAENGTTFVENACTKAETVSKALDCWAVADDSGLEVDYLQGMPGVYSARYAGNQGDDSLNNEKLLSVLAGVHNEARNARFVSLIALARPLQKTVCFEGICEGTILTELRGQGGFGYDALFLPLGEQESFAEMSAERKNLISHRAIAMAKLREHLGKL